MRIGRLAAVAALSSFFVCNAAMAVRTVVIDPAPAHEQIASCLRKGEIAEAQRLVNEQLARNTADPAVLYNAACVYCRLDEPDVAAEHLLKAVTAGFDNFNLMRRDPDLEPIRGHPTYRAILDAKAIADRMLGEWALEQWKRHHADGEYRYETDDQRHLYYATTLDEQSQQRVRRMLDRQADQLAATLFNEPPVNFVLIALPIREDAAALLPDANIGGAYQHARRRLISRDTGASLRHEFTHLLHHAHMDALGQEHPLWIQEGLASLYEDYELGDDGTIRFLPNERRAIVKYLASRDRLMTWDEILALQGTQLASQAARLYPQARSIMEFIADRGMLQAWYAAYVKHFEEDASGARALEMVFEQPIDQIERQWRQWLDEQPVIVTAPHGEADDSVESALQSDHGVHGGSQGG